MIYVHIKNIDKYNPGYTDRKHIWAKIYYDIFIDEKYQYLDEIDRHRLISLIVFETYQQKSIPLTPTNLALMGWNIKKRSIPLTLKMLHTFIDVRNENVTQNRVEKNRIEKNICSFPFDKIWEKYPRRVGKKKAETYFKTSVKTDQDWKDIDTALNNYLNSERVKKGYIQNGCTWFGNWRDWINYTEAYCSKCKNTGKYKTTGPRGTFENYCSCEKGKELRKEEGGR